ASEGYSPFWRDSERSWEATMIAIVNEPPRPPARSGRLADITLRMLHKDPNRRADAHEVLAVLEQILTDRPAPPLPPRLQVPIADHPAQPDLALGVSQAPRREPDAATAASSPRPASPERRPADPGGLRPGGGGRGPRFNNARELIRNVGTDTGVAMLLAMSEDDAVRILADCAPGLC